MAVELNLTLDRRNLARFRTLLKANRMMAAKSLTHVAYKARDAWKPHYSLFHLRRRWLTTGGRVDMATPGNLISRIKHLDKYFARHVKGIDAPKVAGGTSLFVPAQPIEQQGTHTQIRAMLRRAGKTKTKPKFRVRDMILRRMGKKSDAPVKLLGVLRKNVDIEPRFDAVAYTDRAVRQHFPTVYEKLLVAWSQGKG